MEKDKKKLFSEKKTTEVVHCLSAKESSGTLFCKGMQQSTAEISSNTVICQCSSSGLYVVACVCICARVCVPRTHNSRDS